MDDPSLHDAINDYVTADEPPMGLTAASTLHAARRSRRVHQTFATLGASVAALALVSVYLGAHPSGAGPGRAAGEASQIPMPSGDPSGLPFSGLPTPPPMRITPTACVQVPSIDIIPPKQSPSHGYRRPARSDSPSVGSVTGLDLTTLDCALRTRMITMLPTARYYVNPSMPVDSEPLRAFFLDVAAAPVVEAGIVDGRSIGTLFINVVQAGMACDPAGTRTTATQTITTVSTTLPTGQRVCADTIRQPATGQVDYSVSVTSDSTLILATCSNLYVDGRGASRVSGSAPPLTLDQLIQLASDPDLAIY